MKRISRAIKKISFGTRIFIIFVMMLVILVFLLSTLLYGYFHKTVEESVRQSISNSISANEASIQSILIRLDIASDLVCDSQKIYTENVSLPRVFQFVNEYEPPAGADEAIRTLEELKVLRELLESYVSFLAESGKKYECVLYIDEAFDFAGFLPTFRVERSQENDVDLYSAGSIRDKEWYQKVRDSSNMEFVVEQDEEKHRIYMYKPLICKYIPKNEYKIIECRFGVMYISFDVSWIAQSIAYNNLTPRAGVFLVDKNHRIVYSTGQLEHIGRDQRMLDERLGNMQTGVAESISYNGEMYIMQYNSLADNIGMVTIVPNSDVSELVNRTISVIVTMTIVILACGILITFLLSAYIIRPIKRLSEHMEVGTMGKIECNDMGEDEIGSLYKGFNRLMERISQLISDVYRETDEKHRAEMRALQAQINPHFVYNTLDTVCGRSLLRGETDIADILTSLSQIMRYSTKKPEELVPLSKEIEIIKKYEVIQSACYENGICFEYLLDPKAMSILVPKLIIQPLVENAILYGMDLETRKNTIKIFVIKEGKRLVIDVVDTGVHAPIDKMNKMFTEKNEDDKSDSLGIRNVYERLKGVYGAGGNLIFLQNENENTIARISISDFIEGKNDYV